ncbi:MAG TPA: FAD-dependent oxidoreductase [Candidatus Paceibacterota bacterium]|nr:FAD-dependent oxidoreductase [Candidatus Paceibacterota bacterium]
MHDLIIIGGGPAGVASAIYSVRKGLDVLMVTKEFGGQSIVSDDIQNWIGEKHISGVELAEKFESHVKSYDLGIQEGSKVVDVRRQGSNFEVEDEKGELYEARAVMIATGGRRRRLKIPGEDDFEGKGVVYCSTCDAPLFDGKRVVVVGGGNAGVEAVIDLLPYADKIYLLEKTNKLNADEESKNRILHNDKVEVILNSEPKKIKGDKMVDELVYEKEGEERVLNIDGVFVEVGSVPNSGIVEGLVDLDKWGQIKIDSKYGTTSEKGVFAAGDVTDDPYKQNNIAAGDGVKAALSAYSYLQDLE